MAGADLDAPNLEAALSGGDVASVIVSPMAEEGRLEETAFLDRANALVPLVQRAGAAAIIAFETRVAARASADGVHLEGIAALPDGLPRGASVGIGKLDDRDAALRAGEMQIDYVLFGRLHRDIRPEPHARNLKLAQWWSQVVALPCIVPGGSAVDSVVEVAEAGADFVALQSAIFAASDPAEAVARANALLDQRAPRFEA